MLGPPGSGKGTQARMLSHALNIDLIDVGKLLREEALLDSNIKKIMNSGLLLSDDVVNEFIKSKIKPVILNFILDGFPRTIIQAMFLEDMLKNNGFEVDTVIKLSVSDDILIKRLSKRLSCSLCGAIYNIVIKSCLSCGGKLVARDDDQSEVVKLRLAKYNEQSEELVRFYGNKVLDVNGNDTVNNVMEKIISKINCSS
ncbi:MAG: nucleoside monophosphate kinase [Rickettsiaceae bacterium H1]|nr:nucleoside monophosphate kinase [Rickettsiaceae bacterium H1]